MTKSILNLGNKITKTQQKTINGGAHPCDTYSGPNYYDQNSCDAFHALPPQHQICARVHILCFPM